MSISLAHKSKTTLENSKQHSAQAANALDQPLESCLQPFVTIESQWWDWKYNSRIHYRRRGSEGPNILLVHGFGVGAFHFEQLIQKLSKSYQVWAIDLLGQGMSWPVRTPLPGMLSS